MEVRAPLLTDAPAVLALIVARDVADLGRPDSTLDDVVMEWSAPGVDLARDAWIAEEGGTPVGYALLDDRGAVRVTVAPDRVGSGVGTLLREAAERRAAERGQALVRQYVAAANAEARAHLLAAGYWPAYSYFRLRMATADAPRPAPDVVVRPFSRGPDDAAVHALVAGSGASGDTAPSLEAWQAAKVEQAGRDFGLWLLHEDARGLAGVVLCERSEDGTGYVDALAVAERSRGRGLEAALLGHGLAALRAAGAEAAEATVEGANASVARLYESVGMRAVWTIERWEKSIGDA